MTDDTQTPTPRPAHQQRVLAERAELATRLSNLQAFTGNVEAFGRVHHRERALLLQQAVLMAQYLAVLDKRAAGWAENERGNAASDIGNVGLSD